jgi:copper transport protein
MLNRFSPAAYISIALFVVSGAFAAKVHIPSWYAFFNSVYGKTLIVKMVLIGGMMLTSALTVYVLRPQLRQTLVRAASDPLVAGRPLLERLMRWLHVNPVLGAGVLLATSVMFYYPVPAGFSPAGPSAYVAHAAGLTATLTIKPDKSGPNEITVVLKDQQGRPVQQARLIVLTTMLDMAMGTGLGDLNQTKPGTFTGTTDLGMGGHWRLTILVYRPSGLSRMNVEVRVGT